VVPQDSIENITFVPEDAAQEFVKNTSFVCGQTRLDSGELVTSKIDIKRENFSDSTSVSAEYKPLKFVKCTIYSENNSLSLILRFISPFHSLIIE